MENNSHASGTPKVIIIDDDSLDKTAISMARMHFERYKIPYEVVLLKDLKDRGIERPASDLIFPIPPLFDVPKKPMNKPIRIQRKRTKGWKMPENTIYVGRPTKWGNPYQVTCQSTPEFRLEQIRKYEQIINTSLWMEPNPKSIRKELRGKNLACWCKIGDPCHADVLLKIANP
jgi:hypothetical protein